MARCLVTRDLPGSALDRLRAEHEVDLWEHDRPLPRAQLLARAGDADGLLSMLTDAIDRALLERAPRLRCVSNYAVGLDNVDLDAAAERGIAVRATPDVLTETTADLAVALMLAAARRLVEADGYVRAGRWRSWEPGALLGRDVHGARLGIVGRGRIGAAVARRATGFGMEVVHSSRSSGLPLADLLERSDFVSIHCPLTDATRGLIGAAELRRMRSDAVLVNTARGPIVDTDALTSALAGGRIAGAALDVTDPEPFPADHRLLALPNVVVAPHIGSATRATRERMAELAVDNLIDGLG